MATTLPSCSLLMRKMFWLNLVFSSSDGGLRARGGRVSVGAGRGGGVRRTHLALASSLPEITCAIFSSNNVASSLALCQYSEPSCTAAGSSGVRRAPADPPPARARTWLYVMQLFQISRMSCAKSFASLYSPSSSLRCGGGGVR